jgi:hypothetical protein
VSPPILESTRAPKGSDRPSTPKGLESTVTCESLGFEPTPLGSPPADDPEGPPTAVVPPETRLGEVSGGSRLRRAMRHTAASRAFRPACRPEGSQADRYRWSRFSPRLRRVAGRTDPAGVPEKSRPCSSLRRVMSRIATSEIHRRSPPRRASIDTCAHRVRPGDSGQPPAPKGLGHPPSPRDSQSSYRPEGLQSDCSSHRDSRSSPPPEGVGSNRSSRETRDLRCHPKASVPTAHPRAWVLAAAPKSRGAHRSSRRLSPRAPPKGRPRTAPP